MWYTQSLREKFFVIITFRQRYVRKVSNCYYILQKIFCEKYFAKNYILQNISRKIFFAIFSIFIRYAILRFNIYIYNISIQSIAYCTNIYQVPECCPVCSCILIYVFWFSKYYWLSNQFLFQGIRYLLLTWSNFVWCHVISSYPSKLVIIKTLSSLFDVLCQSEFRYSAKYCACVKMVFVGTDMSWD